VNEREDAYGRAMLDAFEGRPAEEIVERDDGVFYVGAGPSRYLAPFREWPAHERTAMRWASGRVLDAGCGAGRVIVHLQDEGLDVVGFDVSPLAVEVCRRRGAKSVSVMPITRIGRSLGRFETIVMLGGNFGLLGTASRACRLLRRMHGMTTPHARILAATRDPNATADADDREYMRRNEAMGRMPGQFRIRIRYGKLCTPWFHQLTVAVADMDAIVRAAGWRIETILEGREGRYVGVLSKEPS
jgi:SAM-dependent methyltransferase